MFLKSLVKWFFIFHFVLPAFGSIEHIKTRTDKNTQAEEVRGLLERLIPSHSSLFIINILPDLTDGLDKVILKSEQQDDQVFIQVTANNGIAATWGIHHYLKYYCQVHISWNDAQLDMPDILPEVDVSVDAVDRFRYHQNVCVYSYTFAFWNWSNWEKHIDWMALNGINAPLAFTGQEEIWRRVYSKLGVSDEELATHFAGPGFLAWGRMGNLNSWGGPLWPGWHQMTVELQHKILDRMKGLGMTPIIPAFAGHVPKGILDLYKPNYTEQYWYGFGPTYLIEFSDPLFVQIGSSFINEYQAEFGATDHMYNCDTFNEMNPETNDTTYLANSGKAIYKAMTSADPDAVWVMQGWIFYFQSEFWQLPQVEALLTSVPQGSMIILDLYSTHEEQYTRTKSYFGQPFIFNDLSNFGGNPGLFGHIDLVNTGPAKARLPINGMNSTMVGTGYTMEGLDLTYPSVDLLSEMSWRTDPFEDLDEWFDNYTTRRYGNANSIASEAWKTLIPGVLNSTLKETFSILTNIPDPKMQDNIYYNPEDVNLAWDLIIEAVQQDSDLGLQETFRYDLVDITRQAIVNLGSDFFNLTMESYFQNDLPNFVKRANNFMLLLEDLERLAKTDIHFLLGPWIESAKSLGDTEDEKALLEYNARVQLTLWGPKGEHLDYAYKHWSGLIEDYYAPRWNLFFQELREGLIFGHSFNKTKFRQKFFEQIGTPFTKARKIYPTTTFGDSVEVALELHNKYRPDATINTIF